jgi:hypothetical protein
MGSKDVTGLDKFFIAPIRPIVRGGRDSGITIIIISCCLLEDGTDRRSLSISEHDVYGIRK